MNAKEAIENLCDLICRGKATIVCCDDDGDIYDVDCANEPWNGSKNRIGHVRKESEYCPIARCAEEGAVVGGACLRNRGDK